MPLLPTQWVVSSTHPHHHSLPKDKALNAWAAIFQHQWWGHVHRSCQSRTDHNSRFQGRPHGSWWSSHSGIPGLQVNCKAGQGWGGVEKGRKNLNWYYYLLTESAPKKNFNLNLFEGWVRASRCVKFWPSLTTSPGVRTQRRALTLKHPSNKFKANFSGTPWNSN